MEILSPHTMAGLFEKRGEAFWGTIIVVLALFLGAM
jgi:hypothetical protein